MLYGVNMDNNIKSWKESLNKLTKGNKKYLTALVSEGDISAELRKSTFINGQKPYAVVISCSDSRVIPESIFSANIGDLFVIRTVGNVVDSTVLASMDYAVNHLNVPLVVLLGHTGCGAINSAIKGDVTGRIKISIDKIKSVIGSETDDYTASKMNVKAGVKEIKQVLTLEGSSSNVVGAIYQSETGKVEFFDEAF